MKETHFMFAKKTILFIFAHMDDETILSYGTICKMADAGANVILYCICSAGRMELSDIYTLKHHNQRTETFHEFRLSKYIHKSECAYQNDLSLTPKLVQTIFNNAISKYKPDIVVTHWSGDLHFEHRLLGEASLVACRCVLGSSIKQLWHVSSPVSKWSYGQINGGFMPNLFIDTSKYKNEKLEMLHKYTGAELPIDNNDLRSADSIIKYDELNGHIIGVDAAEAYIKVFEVI